MRDWYTEAKKRMLEELADTTGLSLEDVETVYNELSDIGFIDYDIEKDILLEDYCDEDES